MIDEKKSINLKGMIWWFLIILALSIVAFSFTKVVTQLFEYREGDSAYEKLSQDSGMSKPGETDYVNFNGLAFTNPDIVGWIYSEGTEIDYPVVQGDDNVYYLDHLFDGAENLLGTIFVDYRNSSDFSDYNTMLYGHHMKNGSMFASLMNYKEQDYYDAHPNMILYTLEGLYRVDLFSAYIVEADDSCYTREFDSDQQYDDFLNNLKERSCFESKVKVTTDDRIITLSTCTYEFSDARFVVHGKMVNLQ